MKLIVGLGNPGKRYADTRHNIGWRIIEAYADSGGAEPWRADAKHQAAIAKRGDQILIKPLTYMNASGAAVSSVARFFKIPPSDILVISDDFQLPFGELRWREKGRSGGQKGLASVLDALGTEAVPRLRVGIGQPGESPEDFVLRAFTKDEQDQLPPVIDTAVKLLQEKVDE